MQLRNENNSDNENVQDYKLNKNEQAFYNLNDLIKNSSILESQSRLLDIANNCKTLLPEAAITNLNLQSQSLAKAFIDASKVNIALNDAIGLLAPSFNALHNLLPSLSESILSCSDGYANITKGLNAAIKPLCESLDIFKQIWPSIDWDKLQEVFKIWGSYGWVDYSLIDCETIPESLSEANSIAPKFITQKMLNEIIEDIKKNIAKRKDFYDCIYLYENKLYKPCAMMLFSLIDCELYKKAKGESGKKRKAQSSYEAIIFEGNLKRNSVTLAIGALESYKLLTKQGCDFNRNNEIDINRNFLMHGMRYKPVRKYHCIKLFALLRATCKLMKF